MPFLEILLGFLGRYHAVFLGCKSYRSCARYFAVPASDLYSEASVAGRSSGSGEEGRKPEVGVKAVRGIFPQFLSICQSAKLHACSLHKLRLVHTLVQSCEHASGNQESHLLELELRFPLWYRFSRYPGLISTDEHVIHMKQQNTFVLTP